MPRPAFAPVLLSVAASLLLEKASEPLQIPKQHYMPDLNRVLPQRSADDSWSTGKFAHSCKIDWAWAVMQESSQKCPAHVFQTGVRRAEKRQHGCYY